MRPQKLFVSVTDEDGYFKRRGMASEKKTLEVFREFRDECPGGRAGFALLSQHDGRISLRCSTEGMFDAEIIGRAYHAPAFLGLLPAKPEIAIRNAHFPPEQAEAVIHALYTYGRTQFLYMVRQEAGV